MNPKLDQNLPKPYNTNKKYTNCDILLCRLSFAALFKNLEHITKKVKTYLK